MHDPVDETDPRLSDVPTGAPGAPDGAGGTAGQPRWSRRRTVVAAAAAAAVLTTGAVAVAAAAQRDGTGRTTVPGGQAPGGQAPWGQAPGGQGTPGQQSLPGPPPGTFGGHEDHDLDSGRDRDQQPDLQAPDDGATGQGPGLSTT